MNQSELIRKLKGLRPALEAEGVTHVALFGSRARGDQKPSSDVDLILDVDPDSGFSLLDLVGIEHLVSDRTGLSANAFMRRGLDAQFRSSIQADMIQVF
jgi:predicted nucleotidyltransferase